MIYGGELEPFALVGVIAGWVGWTLRGWIDRRTAYREARQVALSGTWRLGDQAYQLTPLRKLDEIRAALDSIAAERKAP